MIMHGEPVVFGPSRLVVTEKNLRRAYNATIRVVEIVDDDGKPVRVCIPMLSSRDIWKNVRGESASKADGTGFDRFSAGVYSAGEKEKGLPEGSRRNPII